MAIYKKAHKKLMPYPANRKGSPVKRSTLRSGVLGSNSGNKKAGKVLVGKR